MVAVEFELDRVCRMVCGSSHINSGTEYVIYQR